MIAFVVASRHRHILPLEDFERTPGRLFAEVDGERFVDRSEDSHQPLSVVFRALDQRPGVCSVKVAVNVLLTDLKIPISLCPSSYARSTMIFSADLFQSLPY